MFFKKYLIYVSLFIFLLSSHLFSFAKDNGFDCVNRNTQSDMNYCSYQDFKKLDEKLNKTYKSLMDKSNKKAQKLLLKAELDWIKFKESHCKHIASYYDGGSIQPLIYNTCLTEVTESRTKQLTLILNDSK